MKQSGTSKPGVKKGWMRALWFTIAFFLVAGIAEVILFPEMLHAKSPASVNDVLKRSRLVNASLLISVISVLLVYIFRRWMDRKSFMSLGLDAKGFGGEATAGAALAIFIVGASSLLLKVTAHLHWTDILFDPKTLFLSFGTLGLIALSEEIIFRGYILSNLLESLPKWSALLISSLAFMLFHWSSPGFFPLVNSLIIGLILGLNFMYSRNLWFSVFFHWAWKFLETPLLGFPGEGNGATLLQTDITGDENITGGVNGLEGSFLLFMFSLLAGIALYVILQKRLSPQSPPVPGRI